MVANPALFVGEYALQQFHQNFGPHVESCLLKCFPCHCFVNRFTEPNQSAGDTPLTFCWGLSSSNQYNTPAINDEGPNPDEGRSGIFPTYFVVLRAQTSEKKYCFKQFVRST